MSVAPWRRSCPAGVNITRDKLVAWINGRLGSNVKSFDDLITGEVYCKLLCMVSPGSLALGKVRRGAKLEHEHLHNFKLLQQGLDKAGLRKEFRIEGLIAGRFRDHFELTKWFKNLLDKTQDDGADGACAARAVQQGQAAAEGGRATQGTGRALPGPAVPAPPSQHPDATRRLSPEPCDEVEKVKQLLKNATTERDQCYSALLSIQTLCRNSKAESAEHVIDEILELIDACLHGN